MGVICQVAYATISGDKVVFQATSTELTKYGVPIGHKNYAAAYCTGLLIARRTLKKFGQDQDIKGKEELDGEEYHIEEEETEKRPFKVILDVGIRRTCVGARMWGLACAPQRQELPWIQASRGEGPRARV